MWRLFAPGPARPRGRSHEQTPPPRCSPPAERWACEASLPRPPPRLLTPCFCLLPPGGSAHRLEPECRRPASTRTPDSGLVPTILFMSCRICRTDCFICRQSTCRNRVVWLDCPPERAPPAHAAPPQEAAAGARRAGDGPPTPSLPGHWARAAASQQRRECWGPACAPQDDQQAHKKNSRADTPARQSSAKPKFHGITNSREWRRGLCASSWAVLKGLALLCSSHLHVLSTAGLEQGG